MARFPALAAIAARCGMSPLGVGAIPDCCAAFRRCQRRPRASRYRIKHCPGKANMTAPGNHRRSAADYSAAG
jgi:hypothetical protein